MNNSTTSLQGEEPGEKLSTTRTPSPLSSSKQPQPAEKPVENAKDTPSDPEKQAPQPEFQEGGFTAWATVAGAWLALFSTFGYINAFGVYQDYYTRTFLNNVTPSAVSWIGSCQFFIPLVMGMWVGRLFDRGYFHHLMIGGSALYIFSMFMLSLAKPRQYYQVFLSQAIGMGLGLGCVFTPSVSISSQHFRRRRALAAGIALSGSSVGAIVHPILLNNLFIKPHVGFAGGTRASAYMLTGCLVIANLIMRTRNDQRKKGAPPQQSLSWKYLLSDLCYVLTITGSFFCQITVYFPAFYIQLYSVSKGIDLNVAFYSVVILSAGSVVGRILPNILADFVGAFNIIVPVVVACSGLMFSILGIKNPASMALVAIFYGIFSGAYLSLVVAVVASLSRTPSEIGQRIGVAFTTNSVAALVGVPIAGELLTDKLLWTRAVIFSAVCVFIGAVFFTAARIVYGKRTKA